MKKRARKSQSGVIVAILIIFLALVCIIILWNVFMPMAKKSSGQISLDSFSMRVSIDPAPNVCEAGANTYIQIPVKRSSGKGDLYGIKFIIIDQNGISYSHQNNTFSALPSAVETKTYDITYSQLGIPSSNNVESVQIVPVFKGSNGEEIFGILSEDNPVEFWCPGEGCTPSCVGRCGGVSDGCSGTCNAICGVCTPDCTGKCGGVWDGCSGTCDANCGVCTPETCAGNHAGYCGTYPDNCPGGGTLDCSLNCPAGKSCNTVTGQCFTLTPHNWQSIASSSDGTNLSAVASNDYIYTSTDSGATWTQRINSGQKSWTSIASSSDGTKLAAIGDGYIYTSTNSGASWTQRNIGYSCQPLRIVSSSDGNKLAFSNGYTNSYIYTSSNSGSSWDQRAVGGSNNAIIASSSDGTNLSVGSFYGYIYTSSNSGASWILTNSGQRSWKSIALSLDGTKLVASSNANIYTLSGVTWIPRMSISMTSIASSLDGTNLSAISSSGYIYTSPDSGITWILTNSGQRSWTSIASSSDGTKLAAVANNDYIYTSTDSGITWTPRSP